MIAPSIDFEGLAILIANIGSAMQRSCNICCITSIAEVDDFIVWQTSKMGRDINPSYLTKMMMDAGAKRVEVRQPTFQSVEDIAVGKLQSKTVLNGGLEDV